MVGVSFLDWGFAFPQILAWHLLQVTRYITQSLSQSTCCLILYCLPVFVLFNLFPSFIFGQLTLQWLHIQQPASGGVFLAPLVPPLHPPTILRRFLGCLLPICILPPISFARSFLANSFLLCLIHMWIGGFALVCVNINLTLSLPLLFLSFLCLKIRSFLFVT